MPARPDFYNPVYYSIIKKRWFIRPFPGLDDIQVNHSQLHQDMFVLAVLDGKREGTYLEIGAHEPIFINNTYLLESVFGWSGVSLEFQDEYVQRHRKVRINRCYLQDATTADYDSLITNSGMGDIIDYLSLDTDPPSVTLAALRKIPHDKYKFRVITFEHDYSLGGSSERVESREYLSALGYKLVVSDVAWGNHVVEDWWVHPDLTNKNIVEQLLCVDDQIHEHDKYMYGAYRVTAEELEGS